MSFWQHIQSWWLEGKNKSLPALPKKYYPIYLNLSGKKVLLVGGGQIALQKIPALLECGATLQLVSPEVLEDILPWIQQGIIHWDERGYETSDLKGSSLVIAATDDEVLQKRIAAEARARGIWVNIVDVPPLCDFIAPAIVTQGDLQIAISTGGASPALAKFLRKKLEAVIGPEYADFVAIAQRNRPEIMKLPKPLRLSLWECLASEGFLDMIRKNGVPFAEAELQKWIAQNFQQAGLTIAK